MSKAKENVVIDEPMTAEEEAEMLVIGMAGSESADGLVSLEAPPIDPYVDNSAGHVGRYAPPPAKAREKTPEEMYQREMLLLDHDGSRRAAEAAVVKTRQLGNSLTPDALEDLHRSKDSFIRRLEQLDVEYDKHQQAYWDAEARLAEICGQRQDFMEQRNDVSRRIIAAERGQRAGQFPTAGK